MQQLKIYVSPGKGQEPKVITRSFGTEKKKRAPGQIAASAVGRGAMGASMAGGLPFALLGMSYSGEKTPFWGKARSSSEMATLKRGSREAEEFSRKMIRGKRAIRALSVAGLAAGAGSALYGPIKEKLKQSAARISTKARNVGKFKNKSTQRILGAPGKSLDKSVVNPNKPIEEVLEKQAALDAAQL